jgi:hypothetical protein
LIDCKTLSQLLRGLNPRLPWWFSKKNACLVVEHLNRVFKRFGWYLGDRFMNDPPHIAVDLGAGSGRVFLAGMSPGEPAPNESAVFNIHPARPGPSSLEPEQIFEEITAGLKDAGTRARVGGRYKASALTAGQLITV